MVGLHAFHTFDIVYKIYNPYLLVMVQQGTACRYPALLAKLFYIPTETKPNTVFFFQLFPLTKEVYILYFVEIS